MNAQGTELLAQHTAMKTELANLRQKLEQANTRPSADAPATPEASPTAKRRVPKEGPGDHMVASE
jgi:hypothetical protein